MDGVSGAVNYVALFKTDKQFVKVQDWFQSFVSLSCFN